LLACVGSLDRNQAVKAQEQGEHGAVVCQLHKKQSSLTGIKTQTTNPSNEKQFQHFDLLPLYNTTAQQRGRSAFYGLRYWKKKKESRILKSFIKSPTVRTGGK